MSHTPSRRYQYLRPARSEMKRAVVGIVVVVAVAFLQASAGLDGFQLLERECGILEPSERMGPKIINGVAATFGAHPWMAYLHTPTFFTCAGTLINHCSFAISFYYLIVNKYVHFRVCSDGGSLHQGRRSTVSVPVNRRKYLIMTECDFLPVERFDWANTTETTRRTVRATCVWIPPRSMT